MISGYEATVSNHGIGGVASAFKFLEIVHTHYFGRDIKEEAMKRRSDDELSIGSPPGSMSSLADPISESSSTASWVRDLGTRIMVTMRMMVMIMMVMIMAMIMMIIIIMMVTGDGDICVDDDGL